MIKKTLNSATLRTMAKTPMVEHVNLVVLETSSPLNLILRSKPFPLSTTTGELKPELLKKVKFADGRTSAPRATFLMLT